VVTEKGGPYGVDVWAGEAYVARFVGVEELVESAVCKARMAPEKRFWCRQMDCFMEYAIDWSDMPVIGW